MSWFQRTSLPRSPRWRFVGVLLVLTLVVAGVLAWEAVRAARSHQDVAHAALRDHATFVAWQFADRAQSKADHYVASEGMWYVVNLWGGEASRDRARSEREPPDAWKDCPAFLRFVFDMPATGGEVRVLDGTVPPDAVRRWLRDSLPVHAREVYRERWSYAMLSGAPEGEPRVVFYTREPGRDSVPDRILGFEADPAALAEAFGYAFRYPLLPPSLTDGAPNAELLSVRIVGPAGAPLYRSEPGYPDTFTARESFGDQWAGLPVEVALRPEIAGELLIGGLPGSRVPWLLGLIALTGLLVASAIVVLRRESELARLRTEFVSNVSHELRTPLAQIRMFAETLLLGRVRSEEESTRALEIVDQEARRLTTLVENILLFSRSERDAMRLNPQPTPVRELLREVLDGFRPLADAREVRVRSELRDDVTARVDPGAVRQIALNFLDNAVKYGPEGQTVTLGLRRGDGAYRLWVDDEGPGVPARERGRVWEPFRRLEQTDEATAGTGIGLSVVRELVRRHGGRTWVEESPAGGARFVVEMPLDPDRAAGTGTVEARRESRAGDRDAAGARTAPAPSAGVAR
jgi:signal transduction histidine kinase